MVSDRGQRLRLRYAAVCSDCGTELTAGVEAYWNREVKRATCLACAGVTEAAAPNGQAGASAASRGAELRDRRVHIARDRWGDDAARVAASVAPDDPSVAAWSKGGDGESRLAAFIDREVGEAAIALHDRVIPGTRNANIDHLFIAATGVWVVDSKTYKGKIEKRDAGPWWRSDYRVYVNGRDRTKLVDGMKLQRTAVRAALELRPGAAEIEVHAALCFVDSEWGLLTRPFNIRGVTVLYPGALRDRLRKKGPLSHVERKRIADQLVRALPSGPSMHEHGPS